MRRTTFRALNPDELLSRLCQSLYFGLRNSTSFSWLRSNFFTRYQSYQEILAHAQAKPASRTAISIELAIQIDRFNAFKKMYKITRKIELSPALKDVLNNNKKFLQILSNTHPDFIYAAVDQGALSVPEFFKRIHIPKTDTSTEGNPYIRNHNL